MGKKSNYKKIVFSFLSSIKPLTHKFQLSKIARINYHWGNLCNPQCDSITILIIKITISSLVIGLKKAYFPLIRLPSCYRIVCYWIVCYWTVCYRTVQKANHIQRCSLKQPITFKVVITCAYACACFCVFAFFLGFAFVF